MVIFICVGNIRAFLQTIFKNISEILRLIWIMLLNADIILLVIDRIDIEIFNGVNFINKQNPLISIET